jgi:hypothetical protein
MTSFRTSESHCMNLAVLHRGEADTTAHTPGTQEADCCSCCLELDLYLDGIGNIYLCCRTDVGAISLIVTCITHVKLACTTAIPPWFQFAFKPVIKLRLNCLQCVQNKSDCCYNARVVVSWYSHPADPTAASWLSRMLAVPAFKQFGQDPLPHSIRRLHCLKGIELIRLRVKYMNT